MRIVTAIARWIEVSRARHPADEVFSDPAPIETEIPLARDITAMLEVSKRREMAKAEHRAGVEREKVEAANQRVPTCFFCGEPATTDRIVVGHSEFASVAICEQCVDQCVTIIAEMKAKRAGAITDHTPPFGDNPEK